MSQVKDDTRGRPHRFSSTCSDFLLTKKRAGPDFTMQEKEKDPFNAFDDFTSTLSIDRQTKLSPQVAT